VQIEVFVSNWFHGMLLTVPSVRPSKFHSGLKIETPNFSYRFET